ncbi:DUF4296 domain-containing protein [Myroides pelagicus]|uniref:DUF4296 domain-containing protein n=1 Tax=Myroides pelagicus TaxID=270914 RepID=A0A7K1GK97_9FLAO|nr:DUF4296 domain-containing protein [Myroides pelagicus]MEC4113058.1 DUF4296 domain-containing protein [Myroides pelagicus]MTH28939.1 DUF4296 domain-containing protein [Myroides pelagicus]
MKKLVYLFLVLFVMVSCQTKKPKPFIEEDTMEAILYDIAILYAINNSYVYTATNDSVPRLTMQSIFNKYQIDSLTFTTNNQYYINLNKGVYQEIQDKVYARIKLNQAMYELDDYVKRINEIDSNYVKAIRNSLIQQIEAKQDSMANATKGDLVPMEKIQPTE